MSWNWNCHGGNYSPLAPTSRVGSPVALRVQLLQGLGRRRPTVGQGPTPTEREWLAGGEQAAPLQESLSDRAGRRRPDQ